MYRWDRGWAVALLPDRNLAFRGPPQRSAVRRIPGSARRKREDPGKKKKAKGRSRSGRRKPNGMLQRGLRFYTVTVSFSYPLPSKGPAWETMVRIGI